MKAIILAAGRGSRMKKLTEDKPKCLIKINEVSLLDSQLRVLSDAGIEEIAIVTGYKRELLTNREILEFHNARWAETNMVSSLECAKEWLEEEPCIVSYSDIFYEVSAVTSLLKSQSKIAVTYDPNWLALWERRFGDPLLDCETFKLSSDGSLFEIGNKPRNVEEVEGQYMGLLRFSPEGWTEFIRIRSFLSSVECDRIHMTGMLQKVIDAGNVKVAAIAYKGAWGEVDNAEDLNIYHHI